MTSQIALFNSLGVAIASDTVTTHSQGSSLKTTNNAEKIWPLGHPHLVVSLHSGSVVINNFNVRNLVTEWARTLKQPLGFVTDYSNSFLAWLDAHVHLISSSSQANRINSILNDHYSFIRRRLNYIASQEDFDGNVEGTFKILIQEAGDHLASLPLYKECSDLAEEDLLRTEGVSLDGIVNDLFGDIEGFKDLRSALLNQARMVLSRDQVMPDEAEVAFVGFGSEEFFAQTIRTHIRGCYGNKWRVRVDEPFGADGSGHSGAIATFAQSESIHGFLRGADFSIIEQAAGFVWDAVYRAVDGDDDVDKANEAEEGFRSKLEEFRWNTYVSPMLDTIGGLALTDLSRLAESLVGIQALRSAAEAGPATVGGFIETLVISRSHGLQWVSRLPGLPT
jgi:hypothetical protein